MTSKKTQTTAKIIFAAGSKGGVGKTMASIAAIDTLIADGIEPVLVESDTSNPDVWKIYGNSLENKLVNLDLVEGWMDLVNFAAEMKGRTIVVNTAARNHTGLEKFGGMLNENLAELDMQMVTFWVINRQRDSLELLKDYCEAMPQGAIHVFRNGYFGDRGKFELYNSSKIRELIESQRGSTFDFPDLADRVVDEIYSKRLTIQSAVDQLPIGNRVELSRWRSLAQQVVRNAIG